MNVGIVVLLIFSIFGIVEVSKSQQDDSGKIVTVDSLCVMDGQDQKCYQDKTKDKELLASAMDGYLCMSEMDFRKVMQKLKDSEK